MGDEIGDGHFARGDQRQCLGILSRAGTVGPRNNQLPIVHDV